MTRHENSNDKRTVRIALRLLGMAAMLVTVAACSQAGSAEQTAASTAPSPATATATFAGGCFWCMESDFDKVAGVISTTSGYTGGSVANPTYEQVSAGGTGHAEAVQVRYDPKKVGYAKLLEVFWHNVDPVAVDRQFCDHGNQYRSAIFYANAQQQRLAEAAKHKLETSGRFDQPIATQVVAVTTFYTAEDYHQDYYKKNPIRYKFYRFNCGRDQRLHDLWGDKAG